MPSIPALLNETLRLFFPVFCAGCGNDMVEKDQFLCLKCISQLPHTGFEKIAGNPVENIFRGRLAIEAASSQFYFSKGHLVQYLIHQLKYKGNKEAGEYLGAVMGRALQACGRFGNIDLLIPLPLFADKEYKRGYNQAQIICNGMQTTMNLPVQSNNVIRQKYTDSQTRKHRAERWLNVDGSFNVLRPQLLEGKKILLVDDVITTGATLEACAQSILSICDTQLYFATLAIASK